MDLFSLIVVAVLGAAAAYLAVRLAWAIARNLIIGLQVRRRLRARLESLRLSRLLRQRGVEPNAYLHEHRIQEIEDRIRSCESCSETARCDAALEKKAPPEAFDFCPNDGKLPSGTRQDFGLGDLRH